MWSACPSVHVCGHVCGVRVCEFMCVHIFVRPAVDTDCLSLLIFAFLFETGSFSEPRACVCCGSNSGPHAYMASIYFTN